MNLDYFDQLYKTSDFMPHGECLVWTPKLMWSHVGSDILTGIAYYLITGLICYFIYKRRDIPFSIIFLLFGAFLLSCGTTHFMAAWTIYYPSYWTEGIIKTINALISIVSAIAIIPLMPKIIALPSLKKANDALTEENDRRKQAEDSLRESRESYRLLVEGTNNLITTVDKAGRFIYVNHIGEIILGKEKGELIGSSAFDFVHPDDRELTEQWFRQCVSKNVSQASFENRQVNSSTGEVFHFLWTVSFHYDDQGELDYLSSIAHNITERKQREDETKRNELRLKRLVDMLQHPAESIHDFLDYALEQVIQLTESKIGYIYHYHDDRREFVLSSWSNGVLPECAVTEKRTCYELDKTGIWGEAVRQRRSIIVNDFQADHPLKKGYPEGHVRLFKFMTVPIFKGEDIIAVVGLANKETDYNEMDILQVSLLMETVWKVTDRMQAEKALSESENRYAMTIAAVNDGLWDWDVQSGDAFFSPLYYSILGYEDKEFPASYASWRQHVHPEDIDKVEYELQQSIKNDRGFSIDLRMKMKSGEWLWVSTRGKTVEYDAEGKVLRMVGTLSDITERKREEDEKATLQIQLNQAQKMESIGFLAGGIAHDFNNILAVIIGFSEQAKRRLPPGTAASEDIDQVINSGTRAISLVRQILDLSRQTEQKQEPLHPDLIVHEVLQMLRSTLPTTVEIQEDIDPACGTIMADHTKIHQVIMNLCTNAFHAMKNEKGILRVTLSRVNRTAKDAEKDNRAPVPFIVLTISDTGHGMSPETIAHIFDPYFTTKVKGDGTGLGLALVHGIIDRYKGFIEVESEYGKGSTFRIFIPAMEQGSSTPEELKQEEPLPIGTERILVVDDEPLLVRLNMRLLENYGYTVTGVTDSRDALEKVRAEPTQFDLIITDQTMPGLTGSELAKAVLEIAPGIPIIVCTGHSSVTSAENALAMGIKRYLMKPVKGDELVRTVRMVLDERQ